MGKGVNMYENIAGFFSGIPFFQTPLFGIIALVIVGTSWCGIGLVMGDAPKRGVEPSLVQLLGAVVSLLAGGLIMFLTSCHISASLKVTLLTSCSLFTGSAVNFFMMQLLSNTMQKGPNGIIWSITQSSFVLPFLTGIFFFNVAFTLARGLGIASILIALLFFGLARGNKGNAEQKSSWKYQAFLCFIMAGITQNLTVLPSYFPEAREVPSILRSVAGSSGSLAMAVIYNFCRMTPQYREKLKSSFRKPVLWLYVGALQFFALLFAYTLHYPGMDVLAGHQMGAICYPLLIGSCIASFALAAKWLLKEKFSLLQVLALFFCLGGLVLICL